MTKNARQLPSRSEDKRTGLTVLDDTYTFDANGNVLSIVDGAQAGLTTRDMTYDGLDRLSVATSMGQWGVATYAYDPLDNLRVADQGPRQYRYNYDALNRLTDIKSPAGALIHSFGYDASGNTTNKNAQAYVFDSANRMNQVTGVQTYRYDGQGRRVQTTDADTKTTFWIYSQSKQVMYTSEARRSQNLSYIYLGNTQVATRAVAWGTGTTTVRYQHTDSLGSPVAETDASGNLVKRNAYAPYGEAFGATVIDGTGYTGHVMDRDTGLTYMQQRYYDPQVGRFLNVDPIATDANSGVNFGRYWYANNNPYKFSDPDGRATTIVINGNIGADPATWGGRHAGLVISRDGETSVYDPNGSYRPKNQDRSSSGMFEDASAEDYVNYQKTDGPDVRTYTFNTTPEQEAAILNRIQPADGSNGEGEAGFFSCSTHVSNVLSGIGPLANVNRETLLPSNLESQIVEAKNAQDQLAKEPKMQVIGEIR